MCYWRKTRGCPIVAMEFNYRDADVVAVNKNGMVIETEVKTNIRNLREDKMKTKHWFMEREVDMVKVPPGPKRVFGGYTRVHYFYFAVPVEIKDKALAVIEEKFPYAGLLSVGSSDHYQWEMYRQIVPPVWSVRKAHRFTRPKLTQDQLLDIAIGMSNTACRLAYGLMMGERET